MFFRSKTQLEEPLINFDNFSSQPNITIGDEIIPSFQGTAARITKCRSSSIFSKLPYKTITHLWITSCSSLERLDLSLYQSITHLDILDCLTLSEIILPTTNSLTFLRIIQTSIKAIELHSSNLSTLILEDCGQLSRAYGVLRDNSRCIIYNCPNLNVLELTANGQNIDRNLQSVPTGPQLLQFSAPKKIHDRYEVLPDSGSMTNMDCKKGCIIS
ncbi:MAG: hypothetical protein FJ161_04510 [Gammaproteobacteria bacterium]|nr:hypothetical protein [Gammaproteobacteria bacterium]